MTITQRILILLLVVFSGVSISTYLAMSPDRYALLGQAGGVTSGLVAYYTFDDGSATDSSGNGNNGVISGALPAAGKVGSGSLQFNGTGAQVSTPNIPFSASGFSFSFWYNGTKIGSILGWGDRRFCGLTSAQGLLICTVDGDSTGGARGGSSGLALWHHAVLTSTPSSQSLYIDGLLVGSASEVLNTAIGIVVIGNRPTGSLTSGMGGMIDDVRIYNRPLNVSEVDSLYALGSGVIPPPVIPPVVITPVNGSCGIAARQYATTDAFPDGIYCSAGIQIPVSPTNPLAGASSLWSCQGSNGGTTATCTASRVAVSEPPPPPPPPPPTGVNRVDLLNVSGGLIQSYTTIQACATAVTAGQTCKVYPGTYTRTDVRNSGNAAAKITFSAMPGVYAPGFYLRNVNYIKIEGFTFTGNLPTAPPMGAWMLDVNGSNNEILNNTLTGTFTTFMTGMIGLNGSYNYVHNNTIRNWIPASSEQTAITAGGPALRNEGGFNRVEYNTIRDVEDIDVFEAFGHDDAFRFNTVLNIIDTPKLGTHIDFVQSFGNNGNQAYNMTFENNFVKDFEGQIGQIEQRCGKDASGTILEDCSAWAPANGTIGTISSAGNSITDSTSNKYTSGRWNDHVLTIISGPGRGNIYLISTNDANSLTLSAKLNKDTQTTANLNADGVTAGSSYEIRNRLGWWTFKNNVFDYSKYPASGQMSASIPYLSLIGNTFIEAKGIFSGGSPARGRAWNGVVTNNLHVSANWIYGQADLLSKQTFVGDYNFHSNSAPGYTAKDERCSEEYAPFRFCERVWSGKHGLNGGNPMFQNISNPLGGDNTPFTNDDGLRPTAVVCGKGQGGNTIGAYACVNEGKIFTLGDGNLPLPPLPPPPPPPPIGGDIIFPTVSMTAPTSGSTITGTATLSASASDNIAVAGVQFKVDGTNTGSEDTSSPYTLPLNSTTLSNGTHAITATARDSAGNTTTSAGFSVIVSNVAVVTGNCTATNIRCVGAGQEYTTIQACANVINPGDTCLVYPGNYGEYVQITRGGSASSPVTFRANGASVILKGFRIQQPYTTIAGFDITKYGKGLSPASITVDRSASFCSIKDNRIHDGVFLQSTNYIFDPATRTIRIPSGGLLTAGFEVGTRVYIASTITNQIANSDDIKTITALSADGTTMTVAETLLPEPTSPTQALLYATGPEKDGFGGIAMTISGGVAANNCIISGNTLSYLGGTAMDLYGSNHLIENNIIERMNGWWIFRFTGSNYVFRFNHVRNSPRYPGFHPPVSSTVHLSTGTWDFFAPIFRSFGSASMKNDNNLFEYNMFEGLDNEFALVASNDPTGTTNPALSANGLIYRNNVFAGIEMHGSFHRNGTVFENNTFYKAAEDSDAFVFAISGSTGGGTADNGIIRNNAFVSNNVMGDSSGVRGWYSVQNATMAEAPNNNFVTGYQEQGYPAKAGFTGKEATLGLNGGNPMFKNPALPAGPDGKAFTLDDGLKPLPGSPLCAKTNSLPTAQYNHPQIGAYSCDPNVVFSGASGVVAPAVTLASASPTAPLAAASPVTPPAASPIVPVADVIAPAIVNVQATPITTNAVTVSWTTDESATAQIDYGLSTSYDQHTAPSSSDLGNHSQSITGLNPGTIYHYSVVSTDAVGNTTRSGDGVISTPILPSATMNTVAMSNINTPPVNVAAKVVRSSGTPAKVASANTTTKPSSSSSLPPLDTSPLEFSKQPTFWQLVGEVFKDYWNGFVGRLK